MSGTTVYIGLGANLGDREAALRAALDRLGTVPGVTVEAVSSLRETEPVGGPPQGRYLNGVARLGSHLDPHALLAILKQLEREAGRRPGGPRNAPRELDLDILLFGDRRIDSRELIVPHPRMAERAFVLEPLAELGVDPPERPVAGPECVVARSELARRCEEWRRGGCTVGLVPTMGALHAGHASLLRRARDECDRVVATVFVNPLQFGPSEDLARYPRTLDGDLALCAAEGVDLVFTPTIAAMYGDGFCSHVAVGAEAESMEGAVRPGHFAGVATVVALLLTTVRPDLAYFGEKDAQQLAVIGRMHRDLGLPGVIRRCAIVREPDGLAMSSRNVFLDAEHRAAATVLHRALLAARDAHLAGAADPAAIQAAARAVLDGEPRCRVDYLELRRADDLAPLPPQPVTGAVRLLVAAKFGATRLIDNLVFRVGDPS